MTQINPYLTFKNNCEEAFDFYREVFGGEFLGVMRMGDMQMPQPIPDEAKDLIMHIALPIGQGSILMGSDAPENCGGPEPFQRGNNMSIALAPDSKEDADRFHSRLSDGGRSDMPMSMAPWGDYFGMATDRYGIQWLINFSERSGQAS